MSTFNGVIEKLYVKFNDKAKRNSISIINQGSFYGLGLHDEKTVKVGNVVLKDGMTVEFEYSGKFKNIDMVTLKVVKTKPSKEVVKAKVDKSLPIRLGNSLTVASHFTNTHIDLVDLAKQLLPKIDALQAKLVEKYPDFDDYSRSARCGQCVVMAAQFTKNQDNFIEVAEQLFDELCLAEEELRNLVVKDVKETKKEKKVEEAQQTNIVENISSNDWDDSIPF
jgi:hypothetical protein